jgi:hypothetical protein
MTDPEIIVERKKYGNSDAMDYTIKMFQRLDENTVTIDGVKYKRVEEPQPKMEFQFGGKFEIVSYNDEEYLRLEFADESHGWYKRKHTVDGLVMVSITDGETHRLLEGLWFNDVRKGKYDEPYCPDDPEYYDEVEWDEKDNPASIRFKIADEVIDKLIKEQQAQKLFNRLVDELGYDFDACNDVVDLVEDWILDEQSSAGSQNVNTELLVEGFNDAIRKMKEMLR